MLSQFQMLAWSLQLDAGHLRAFTGADEPSCTSNYWSASLHLSLWWVYLVLIVCPTLIVPTCTLLPWYIILCSAHSLPVLVPMVKSSSLVFPMNVSILSTCRSNHCRAHSCQSLVVHSSPLPWQSVLMPDSSEINVLSRPLASLPDAQPFGTRKMQKALMCNVKASTSVLVKFRILFEASVICWS